LLPALLLNNFHCMPDSLQNNDNYQYFVD